MTQDLLASKTDLSATDIGRIERGEISLGAGGMFDVAVALNIPVAFLFEGIQGQAAGGEEQRAEILLERDAMELVRAYYALPDSHRKGLLDLAQTLRNAAR